MCGRFYIGGNFRDKLNDLMRQEGITCSNDMRISSARDVFPSNASMVICGNHGRLEYADMLWGYSNPYRKGLVINARAETVRSKNLFSDSVLNRRCVIPASGFYEWDPYKSRFRFTRPDGDLMLLAGIYHEEAGAQHYTILTTAANDSMIRIHNRMPVMIGTDEIRSWITDNRRLTEFLERPQAQLTCEQDSGQIRMEFDI